MLPAWTLAPLSPVSHSEYFQMWVEPPGTAPFFPLGRKDSLAECLLPSLSLWFVWADDPSSPPPTQAMPSFLGHRDCFRDGHLTSGGPVTVSFRMTWGWNEKE
jgi:hypothetical protein